LLVFHEHWFQIDALAELFKMSPKSSGFLQLIGALKQFGLILEKGSNEDREFQLTSCALDLVHCAKSSREYKEALRSSAILPTLHSELWEKYGGKLPPEDCPIRTYLVRQRQDGTFNPDHVGGFIEQLRGTLTFSGMDGNDTIPQEDESREITPGAVVSLVSKPSSQFRVLAIDGHWAKIEGSDEREWMEMKNLVLADDNQNKSPPPGEIGLPQRGERHNPAGTTVEEWSLDEGAAVLKMPSTLSSESVDELEYWLKGIMKKARRRAGKTDPEDAE
jgi:hypothetical protein